MNIVEANGRVVVLGPSDAIGQGGEASVYGRDDVAYKIYDDPTGVPAPAKLGELAAIGHPRVLAPTGFVRDEAGTVIGVRMPLLGEAWAASQLGTPSFAERHGFGFDDGLALLEALAELLHAVHRAGCCVVDLSGTNVLVHAVSRAPYLIDVDSFQTPSFAASAHTPAFADPTHAGPRRRAGVDWYAWAVLGFSLLIGVHPFRGKHPRLHGLPARVAARVSAFDPAVALPKCCRSPSAIPEPLRAWMRDVFERDLREPPPVLVSCHRSALHRVTWTSEHRGQRATIERGILHLDGRPLGAAPSDVRGLAWTDGGQPIVVHATAAGGRGLWSPERGTGAGARAGEIVPLELRIDDAVAHSGVLYVRSGDRVGLLRLRDRAGAAPLPLLHPLARIRPRGSVLGPGVVVHRMLGRTQALLLSATRGVRTVGLGVLDRVQVLDAAADGPILVVLTSDGARCDRWVFLLDDTGGVLRRGRWTGVIAHAVAVEATDAQAVVETADGPVRLDLSRWRKNHGKRGRARPDDPSTSQRDVGRTAVSARVR